MKSIYPPFKGASPSNISQGFKPGIHEANDIASSYGTWLVAPFKCFIEHITQVGSYGDKPVDGTTPEVQFGCGISMISVDDPTYKVVYWHCTELFPVKVGDIVEAGEIVAMMGNTGLVSMGGIMISVSEREKEYSEANPIKKGTHVHEIVAIKQADGVFHPIDPSTLIDWTLIPQYNALQAIQMTLLSIKNWLNQ